MAGEMKFCRGCGKQIGADVKFCKYCGFRFDAPKQEAATPQSIQDKMKASLDAGRQKNAAEQSASPAGAPAPEQQSFKDRMRASFEAGKAKGQAFGDRVVGKSAPEPPQPPAVTPAQPAQAPQSSENAPAAKFCRQCGNTVSATAQFCGKCGFRFDTPAQPVSQAQQPAGQQADSFARNRRGGIKHSPIGASARQNLQRAMPSGAKVRKTSKGVLAAVLAFAMLLTGFGWPGWIQNLFDRPNTPPYSYDGGNTTGGNGGGFEGTEELVDPEREGNSAAFRITPVRGMTISAEENALDYDRTFQVSGLTAAALDSLQDTVDSSFSETAVLLDAWDIDAGMETGEFLPGTFTVELDLQELGIDRELYDALSVYRIDDEGTWYRFCTEIDGDTLRYQSRQNSVDGLLLSPFLIYYADNYAETGGETLWGYMESYFNVYDNGITTGRGKGWFFKDDKALGTLRYCLHVELENEVKLEKQRMDTILGRYIAAAEEEITERYIEEGNSPYNESFSEERQKEIRLNIEKEALTEANRLVSYDEEYRQCIERLKNSVRSLGRNTDLMDQPEALRPFAECLLTARTYLQKQIKVRVPTYVMDIYLVRDFQAPGLTVTAAPSGNAYCLFDATRVASGDMDNVLLTVTHELFHACQREYSIMSRSCTKFDEATATMVEKDAEQYYARIGQIVPNENREDGSKYWYYFAIPMDGKSVSYDGEQYEKDESDAGYVWSAFIRFLQKHYKPNGKTITYHQLLDSYRYFSVVQGHQPLSKMLLTAFPMDNMSELHSQYLWFVRDNREEFLKRRMADAGESWAYPSTTFKDGTEIRLTDHDYTTRVRELKPQLPAGYQGEFAVLLGEADGFLTDKCIYGVGPLAQDTVRGVFYKPQKPGPNLAFYVLEADGKDGGAESHYNTYFLTEPEAPTVDVANGVVRIIPPAARSKAAEDGYIDSYQITVYADGREAMKENLPRDRWDTGLQINLQELGYDSAALREKAPVIHAVIRERIEPYGDYAECLGPESQPDDYSWFEGSWRWEDRHGTDTVFDDEVYDLAILSADPDHVYIREVNVWGDGSMNLLLADYRPFEEALILRDVGTGDAVFVLTAESKSPDVIEVTGLDGDKEFLMNRTQESDEWWNDRRLERDKLVEMAIQQGYMT